LQNDRVKLTEKIRQHNNSRHVKLQVVICNDLKKKTTIKSNDRWRKRCCLL